MQLGHGHGVDHAYITGKTVDAHGHQYVVRPDDDRSAHVAVAELDEHQQRALKRLAQFPHELIQGPEAHQLYRENNIHYHEEDPWEAGEVGDDHMTADTGVSLHHGPDVPLHTSQDYLSRAGLEHFIRHPYEPGQHEERPSTWEHEGQHWINGGHHRILADRMTHQRGTEVADRTSRIAAMKTDPPGSEWRSSLPPEHEEVMRQYEKYSPDMTSQQRSTFRKVVKSAPEVEGPVYRGASVKNAYGMEKIKAAHEPGSIINFSKHVSTSTRPEVAAGYGLTVYEIHGHGARGIGNQLHEAIMPPGKFKVHSAEWRDTPAQANIDERTQYTSPRLHVMLHPVGKEAARWKPHERLFGPTQGLDHRLFDGDHLKPDVRRYILDTLDRFWGPQFGDWTVWSIVYFAGSEASEWTSSTLEGNNDFDVLIGVDYAEFRRKQVRNRSFHLMSDQEITDYLNTDLRRLDEQTAEAMIPVEGTLVGPFSNTFYVNKDSYDIRAIKPYAAYDVSHDRWAVKPPELPDWDIAKFPEGPGLIQECRAVAAQVHAILHMPEPYQTQQGYALWQHLHGDRSRAFGPQGEGWYDPANVIEKYLDQEGLWDKLVQIMVRAKSDPTTLNAPSDWSNTPPSSAS